LYLILGVVFLLKVFEAVKKRRDVRSYMDKSIPEEALALVLEAARLAPSAMNRQEWRFIIVKDPEVRKKLAKATIGQGFIEDAPAIIVACGMDDGYLMPSGLSYVPVDVTIALDHITLVAVELGLGTCWIGEFNEAEVKSILGIPAGVRVIHLMTIGYPIKGIYPKKNRLPIASIVKNEHW
jgi:nitroreductase